MLLLTTKGLMEADNFANNAGSIAKPIINNKYLCTFVI